MAYHDRPSFADYFEYTLSMQASGAMNDQGQRWMVELVHGDLKELHTKVLWMDWNTDERWTAYATRVRKLAGQGVFLGRSQLGIRIPHGDAGYGTVLLHGELRRYRDNGPETWSWMCSPRLLSDEGCAEAVARTSYRLGCEA